MAESLALHVKTLDLTQQALQLAQAEVYICVYVCVYIYEKIDR